MTKLARIEFGRNGRRKVACETRGHRTTMEASMDERRLRLSQGSDKNAQCRKRNRIPQEWTYMPDDIRRNKHRKKMLSSSDFIGEI